MKLFNDDFTRADRRPSGMTVPEHFFEDFKASMEQKIDAYEAQRLADATGRAAASVEPASERPHELRLNLLLRRFILWTGVAACFGLLIGLALPFRFAAPDSAVETAPAAADEYAEAETQEQLEQDVMLASLSDYDIFEYYYYEED
jgi:hypothetical protein